jgi:hypothetical protein
VALLAGLKFSLTGPERRLLETYLCPDLRDGIDQVGLPASQPATKPATVICLIHQLFVRRLLYLLSVGLQAA